MAAPASIAGLCGSSYGPTLYGLHCARFAVVLSAAKHLHMRSPLLRSFCRPPPPTPLRLVPGLLSRAALCACILAPAARADDCAVLESRATLASLSGSRISTVSVVSERPDLPGLTRFATPLHPASRIETIRRQLLFAPGDTVDTLLVGETMRRLRLPSPGPSRSPALADARPHRLRRVLCDRREAGQS